MTQLVQRHGGRHRHVQRVRAVSAASESGRGRRPLRTAQRAGPGARHRGRSRPAAGPPLRPAMSPPRHPAPTWSLSARRAQPAPADARTPSPCWLAPPSANRGRHNPARGRPGRRRARARRGRWRRCCPGRQPRGGRRKAAPPRRSRPALAIDADHPGPGAQRAHRAQQRGFDVLSRHQDELGVGPGGRRGGHQVLALGHEQARALALAVGAELPDPLQLLVVGRGDHLLAGRGSAKKNGRSSWWAAREFVDVSRRV